ncbi:putative ribonuclease H-like domain-containing protein [Tanacetum coccineum]
MVDQDTPPPTITAIKIPIIKKGEYNIWSMRMRQYICHTDHNLWDIIVNEDLEDEATPSGEQFSHPYLLKFHNVPDAKSLWAVIKSRFGGNEESKKMQKNVLKHQFENFVTASNETLDKAYDRFQKLISQLKCHEPMSSGSNSASQNLAFLSSKNTNSTNEVSTASGDFGVSYAGEINQVPTTPSGYVDCQRHFARECRSGRSQGRRPYGENGRSNAQTTESSSQALVAQDGLGGYDWSNDFEVEPVNYALMAISSSNSSSSSDSEVQKCSKCLESFKCLQKNYDTEREKHNKAKLEIRGYEIALESLEARILGHEKNELAWGERYEFQNYDLKCHKNLIKILNSQMSTHDKNGLGFGTQMDDLSNKSETDSENSLTVFEVRSSDEESTLENNRFTKANEYHVVPPPITGNPLTPRANISFAGLDEYAFRNKIIESKTTETNKTVDDEDDVCVVKTVSSVKPNVTQAVRSQADKNGLVNTDRSNINTARSISTVRPVYTVRPRSYFTQPVYRPKDLKPDVKTFGVKNMTTVGTRAVVSKGKVENVLKKAKWGNPEILLQDHAVVDSGCSSHMTGNKAYLSDYEDFNGGFVAFGSDPKRGKITGTQDSYVAGSSRKDKGPTQEYILLPLQPHRIRIPIKDVVQDAQEQPSENASPDKGIQDSEDVFDKEGQHQMPEDEQVWQDELEMMVTQELVANAMNDESRQAFEEEKRRIASQKKAAQATSTNQLSTDRPFVSTDRSFVSTDRSNTPNVSAASTSTGANADESSFVYLGGKIPIDASTLPNADLPIDPNMPDLEDASDTLPNDGIFNGAYDDDEDVGAVADFNNMDNTIAVSPIPTLRIHKDHPKGQILGDPTSAVQTRGKIQKASSAQQALVSYIHKQNRTNHKDHQNYLFACFLSQEEPKTISQALKDESWVEAMQEELLQFKLQQNKARIVAQGHRQEEGIDYDEVFAPVARIEAIRLFLAFASYIGFLVYQMDVKSAFLYGTIEEEVYVHQPLGFVDPAYPNKVYKVVKALYGLHQAPRAWYETLSYFSWRMVLEEVKQQPDGIFISQDKYVVDILKKFYFCSIKTATTPIESNKPLVKDEDEASLERKSTTGGCQFLGKRLISGRAKEVDIMSNLQLKAENVAACSYAWHMKRKSKKVIVSASESEEPEIRWRGINQEIE